MLETSAGSSRILTALLQGPRRDAKDVVSKNGRALGQSGYKNLS